MVPSNDKPPPAGTGTPPDSAVTRRRQPCTGRNASSASDIPLSVLSTTKAPLLRSSRMSRWRAISLLAVHVLMAGHFLHWWYRGWTLSPVEPSEAMEAIREGAINAGFVFLVLALLATLVVGRFVCGWGCHVIAYQDLTNWVLKRLHLRPKAFRTRLLVFIPLAAAAYMFGWPIVRRILLATVYKQSVPPFELHLMRSGFWDTFPGPIVAILTILFCGVALIYFLGPKGFCTYACPYGGLFAIADRFAKGRIRVTEACEGCGHCTATCTSNVDVAEEVRLYGMVVDPGCMKCMDCVSVCPNEALYFGFGPMAVGRKPRSVPAAMAPRRKPHHDLSVPEELAALVVFAVLLLVYRGIYGGMIPFLFALGISGIGTFVIMKAARLCYARNVSLQKIRLKTAGRLRPIGLAFVVGILCLLGLTGHSAIWQYHNYRGRAFTADVPSLPLGWQYDPTWFDRVAEPARNAALAALTHFRWCEKWGLLAARNHGDMAWLYLVARDPDQAVRQVRLGTDRTPDAPGAWLSRAMVESFREQPDAAEAALRRALDLAANARERASRGHPVARHRDSADAWLQWGLFLEVGGRFADAADAYKKAVAFDRDSSDARMAQGEFELRSGRIDAARRSLIAALSLNRASLRAARDLAICGKRSHQDFAAAVVDYEAALAKHGNTFVFQRNLAYALASLGRIEPSLEAYRAALKLHPNAMDVRAEYGAMLLAAKDIAGAVREYEAILEARPTQPGAAFRLAELYVLANRVDDALRCYRIAVDHGDGDLAQAARRAIQKLSRPSDE